MDYPDHSDHPDHPEGFLPRKWRPAKGSPTWFRAQRETSDALSGLFDTLMKSNSHLPPAWFAGDGVVKDALSRDALPYISAQPRLSIPGFGEFDQVLTSHERAIKPYSIKASDKPWSHVISDSEVSRVLPVLRKLDQPWAHNVYYMPLDEIDVVNATEWTTTIAYIATCAKPILGIGDDEMFKLVPDKFLFFKTGSSLDPHMVSSPTPGAVARLVVDMAWSEFKGGATAFIHQGTRVSYSPDQLVDRQWLGPMTYAICYHGIAQTMSPIRSGSRLAVTYDLVATNTSSNVSLNRVPDLDLLRHNISNSLLRWVTSNTSRSGMMYACQGVHNSLYLDQEGGEVYFRTNMWTRCILNFLAPICADVSVDVFNGAFEERNDISRDGTRDDYPISREHYSVERSINPSQHGTVEGLGLGGTPFNTVNCTKLNSFPVPRKWINSQPEILTRFLHRVSDGDAVELLKPSMAMRRSKGPALMLFPFSERSPLWPFPSGYTVQLSAVLHAKNNLVESLASCPLDSILPTDSRKIEKLYNLISNLDDAYTRTSSTLEKNKDLVELTKYCLETEGYIQKENLGVGLVEMGAAILVKNFHAFFNFASTMAGRWYNSISFTVTQDGFAFLGSFLSTVSEEQLNPQQLTHLWGGFAILLSHLFDGDRFSTRIGFLSSAHILLNACASKRIFLTKLQHVIDRKLRLEAEAMSKIPRRLSLQPEDEQQDCFALTEEDGFNLAEFAISWRLWESPIPEHFINPIQKNTPFLLGFLSYMCLDAHLIRMLVPQGMPITQAPISRRSFDAPTVELSIFNLTKALTSGFSVTPCDAENIAVNHIRGLSWSQSSGEVHNPSPESVAKLLFFLVNYKSLDVNMDPGLLGKRLVTKIVQDCNDTMNSDGIRLMDDLRCKQLRVRKTHDFRRFYLPFVGYVILNLFSTPHLMATARADQVPLEVSDDIVPVCLDYAFFRNKLIRPIMNTYMNSERRNIGINRDIKTKHNMVSVPWGDVWDTLDEKLTEDEWLAILGPQCKALKKTRLNKFVQMSTRFSSGEGGHSALIQEVEA